MEESTVAMASCRLSWTSALLLGSVKCSHSCTRLTPVSTTLIWALMDKSEAGASS